MPIILNIKLIEFSNNTYNNDIQKLISKYGECTLSDSKENINIAMHRNFDFEWLR